VWTVPKVKLLVPLYTKNTRVAIVIHDIKHLVVADHATGDFQPAKLSGYVPATPEEGGVASITLNGFASGV